RAVTCGTRTTESRAQRSYLGQSFRRSTLPAGLIHWRRLWPRHSKRRSFGRCRLRCISSALVANRIYSETMAQIERGAKLASMLRHLNHFAVQNLASSSFYFTVAAVRVYRSRGRLQFAGAGHPPAIVVRPGQSPWLLESTNMVLGLFENAVGSESESVVEKG